ncbi:MAG: hypothetical protein PHZ14_07380, partial [Sulfuricella sp.]|nr:hypothetical protein [Sulfuricella sp.]
MMGKEMKKSLLIVSMLVGSGLLTNIQPAAAFGDMNVNPFGGLTPWGGGNNGGSPWGGGPWNGGGMPWGGGNNGGGPWGGGPWNGGG